MNTALGINIYGGGFTLGVQKHFKVLGQWEECKLGMRTFDLNFKGIPRPLNFADWPVKKHIGKVDFVFANPPCAPWSIANNHPGKTRESRFLDKRLELTEHTMRTAVKLRPQIFISESVENAYNIGENHYDQYKAMWMRAGYAVTYFLTDAILHGAPCARRRFHFIAHKHDLQLGNIPKIIKPMTVRDAIGDLLKVDGKIALHTKVDCNQHLEKILPLVISGAKLYTVINQLGEEYKGPKRGFLVRRLCWDTPACTMVGFDFIHPDGKRFITHREALRLCTYPDSFISHNAIEAVDAVIPTVANFLANTAKKTIKKARPVNPTFNVVDWRPHGLQFHIRNYKNKTS
jgi:site-specific DNA-cytosine methylase